MQTAYEMVIGLEVHVELKTRTKIFCGCPTAFHAPPNTQCCPVCLGLPGALPVLNRDAVTFAVRAGLATNCRIAGFAVQDRKNYFYPDLPKAYQISQYDHPLCQGGYLDVEAEDGPHRVGITRIHIEEDAGKLLHNDADGTRMDLNRCGVPLIELVTEPDIRSAAQARAFLQKLRAILLCAGVSDCKMNEGSMRCDVNLSVRRRGEKTLGTRTEMKNLNSFAFIVRAIEHEFQRQVDAVSAGESIVQQTRRFDPATGKTYAMRTKENADDYRYFPDPDLPPIFLTDGDIQAIRAALPELPNAKQARYERDFGLSVRDAAALCAQPPLCDAFDAAAPLCKEPLRLLHLMLGELLRLYDGEGDVPVSPARLAALANLLSDRVIHMGAAKQVLQAMLKSPDAPEKIVRDLGLTQVSDTGTLAQAVERVLDENTALVQTYLGGKENALQALMGYVMRDTQGKANPALAASLLKEAVMKRR
ncbi:MAG: Asp-tRNA(Asn)/Glu-tRNA(Gln) amidotransferase subunit GatB [Oscillospiraceae bacterium]|jgi:aspartyl-tRNA(Asn)/glutamyl-tRNA(Gln) amidotransferase subunit B|nr:Asp-tRNA(Asn)/Glu-tRNA(Gln) amidotransferase subunit GatB [Oscillospiraceae bacterium]